MTPAIPLMALLCGACLSATAAAAVTRLEVKLREVLPPAVAGGLEQERLSGTVHGELDPATAANRLVTDLGLAPRNARGRVAYSATFSLVRPVDPAQDSGLLFYDVPNRGNGRATPDAAGHAHLVSGWQGDIPPTAGLQTLQVPVARRPDGQPLVGPVLVRWTDVPSSARSRPLLRGLGAGVPAPPPLALDDAAATLRRRLPGDATGELVPRRDWTFADCSRSAFPGRPDGRHLCLREGFDPRYAYELRYLAKDPPVLGIGFAAVRDLVEHLRGGALGRRPRHALAFGASQSGNFLRSFVHLGFNRGEQGGRVFDGILPFIAARQVPLNLRFGVPGGAAGPYEAGSEGTLWWGDYVDPRGDGRSSSLLQRCRASDSCPKVMEVFGSAEFWGLRMSPDLVGLQADRDIGLPDNVVRYYIAGTTHGGGRGGFEVRPIDPPPGCLLPANPNPMSDTLRALTAALVAWVRDGTPPPPGRAPRLDAGDLVEPTAQAMGFPRILGQPLPDGHLHPFPAQGFGPGFRAADVSGQMEWLPPRLDADWPQRVPRVDADGNETSGVVTVHQQVPLGSYLGWNVARSGFEQGRACGFNGGYIPFARSRAERERRQDPRPSLEERYGDHEGFVQRVRAAAARQVAAGLLLPEDAARLVSEAAASEVLLPR
ncbi:MAG: hypothetical protein RL026_2375 [Pseudomonadota bacterium]